MLEKKYLLYLTIIGFPLLLFLRHFCLKILTALDKKELVRRANAGDADSQYELGDIYYCEYDKKKNKEDLFKARDFFLKASCHGNTTALSRVVQIEEYLNIQKINWDMTIRVILFVDNKEKETILTLSGTLFKKLLDNYCLDRFLHEGNLQSLVEDKDGNSFLTAFYSVFNILSYFGKIKSCRDAELSSMAQQIIAAIQTLLAPEIEVTSLLTLREIAIEFYNIRSSKEQAFDAIFEKQIYIEKQMTEILLLADQGDFYAQFLVGQYYYKGYASFSKDHDKAIEWYEKSANQGCIDAQYLLGMIYHDRNSDKANYDKAIEWFKKAAEHDHPESQYELAYIYFFSLGTQKDMRKAIEWATKAEVQGLAIATDLLKHINFQMR